MRWCAMQFDDCLTTVRPRPVPTPGLGVKKGRRLWRVGVRDAEPVSSISTGRSRRRRGRRDGEGAAGAHGVGGVDEEVDENLFELFLSSGTGGRLGASSRTALMWWRMKSWADEAEARSSKALTLREQRSVPWREKSRRPPMMELARWMASRNVVDHVGGFALTVLILGEVMTPNEQGHERIFAFRGDAAARRPTGFHFFRPG